MAKGYFGSPETGELDFSGLSQIPEIYAKAQERAREDAFRQQLAGGLPMKGGVVDWDAAAQIAARAGSMGGVSQFAQLANAQQNAARAAAAAAETARHNRAVEGAYGRPQYQWDPVDPLNPGAPRTGIAIITDKAGNVRTEPITMPGRAQPTAPQPQQPAGPSPFDAPQGTIPGPAPPPVGSTAPIRPNVIPTVPYGSTGPRSDLSPTDELLARTAAGEAPPPPRGPQFAQVGGPTALPPQPPATPPAAAPAAVPDWLAGAAAPAMTGAPRAQPPAEQRGELRYTAPLGPFNDDAIAQYPKSVQDKIKAIATGRFNIKSTAITGGERAALSDAVYRYFPGFDETLFARRQQTVNAFAKGIEGRVVRAVSNLTDHLETAEELMTALKNRQTPAFNAAVNKWRQLTGYEAELPGNVRAAAPIIAGEMMKVIAGAGAGGVNERLETAINTMSTSSNPQTAIGALNTVKQLMMGQLKGLEVQYENNTYNTDFRQKLTPGARKLMEIGEKGHAPSGAPTTTKTGVPWSIER